MTITSNTLPGLDIQLEVDGIAYSGWTSVEIERGIDQIAGSFSLTLASRERTVAEDWPIADGAECRVTLAGEVLITGFVDRLTRFLDPEARGIEIGGRDRTCDLVDCSSVHSPGSWVNRRLEEIAAELTEPFGIDIDLMGQSTGAPFAKFALQQGETVFNAIERMARYRGLVAWSIGDGTVRIGNPDSGDLLGYFNEGANVVAASGSRQSRDRYSDYIVKGQASGSDDRNGAAVAQVIAQARDEGVSRYRPLVIIGEEQSDRASLEQRARWEAAVRAGRATPAQIVTPGWLDAFGSPLAIGLRARCDVPSADITGELLVERVAFSRDAENGTQTTLDLVPPEAWTRLPEPEPAR